METKTQKEIEETEELHGSIEESAPEITVQENRIESTIYGRR